MSPAKTDRRFAVDFRMMSVLLLIAMIPFLLGAWWLVSGYRASYLESHGISLSEEAAVAFDYVNNHLQNQIIEIAGITEVPTLRAAIEKNNQELKTSLNEAIKKTSAIEARWKSMDLNSPELRAVLDNPAADFLRRYMAVRSSYREIIVTDMVGRTVAATGKTSDFRHAHDLWWKEAYAGGQKGGVYIGDVHYHDSAKAYCMDIAQPFVDAQGSVMGVIMVGISADEIHSLIGSLQAGFRGTAALIRPDGSVIAAPDFSHLDTQPFPHMQDIRQAREWNRGYVITQGNPRNIVGMNSRSFMEISPHLNWILTISSPVDTVVGPLTHLLRNLVVLMLAMLLLAMLAAFWLSRTETRRILQEDAHFL